MRSVHDAWDRWRTLQAADGQLAVLCATVTPRLAPRTAAYLRRARKSLQGAIRHAEGLHQRAQRAAEQERQP